MNIADPHGPMSPYGKVGSIVNVVMSAVFGGIAVVVGIVIGEPMPFVGGLGFWAMCAFAFVPIMRRAIKYERETNARRAGAIASPHEDIANRGDRTLD
ncbi:hypothetical protein [Microbacterium sp. LMC-P-041]|uniref:hypothetical protein n=1 Tax=Microbacterium sp. LMC-P-041 TaxID=3040293 RepID=UPI002556C802|nr:hypothetical protein [Microbacterium sp. LMC-P-041]